MGFTDIVGHLRQLEILRAALAGGRLHHAYVFVGPDGIGKKTMALALAKAIHCAERDYDFCGRCVNCARIADGNHPDVRLVELAPGKKEISIEQIRNMERELRYRSFTGERKVLAGGDKLRKASLGGAKTAAEIINLLGSAVETSVLDYIREADNDLAQKIMDSMFTFDDLIKLDDKGIQALLKEIQSESLVIALKGAAPELRDRIFKNMSTRAAETLKEDLESRGPVRLSEVESEQKELLKTVRRLVDEGQIVMASGGADEFV